MASVGGALSCHGTQHLSTTPPRQVTVLLREHPYTCVPITMFSRVDFHCSDLPAACFPSTEEGTPDGWQGGWPYSPSTYPITDVKQPWGQPLTWEQWAGTTLLRFLGCDPGERRGCDTPAVPSSGNWLSCPHTFCSPSAPSDSPPILPLLWHFRG